MRSPSVLYVIDVAARPWVPGGLYRSFTCVAAVCAGGAAELIVCQRRCEEYGEVPPTGSWCSVDGVVGGVHNCRARFIGLDTFNSLVDDGRRADHIHHECCPHHSRDETARFDERSGANIFVLLAGTGAAGWNSPLGELASLPGDAEAAVPDGRGGIVFVTDAQVWWIREPSAEPAVIEQPGIPVHLVGLRYIDGEPEVLVLIGQKLIGYDQGRSELRVLFDQIAGDVVDIDVDGDHAVLVVGASPVAGERADIDRCCG